MSKRIDLTDEQLIAGLFEYIRLNKAIPEFFADVKKHYAKHEHKINALQAAISSGDFKAGIFDDEHATLYVLYLIKEKILPYLQGMTIYTYLTALAQFTNRQPLKSEDQDVKSLRPMDVKRIAKEGKLTQEGEEYLKKVCDLFKQKTNLEIDYSMLVNFVIDLPPSEQSLLEIKAAKLEGDIDTYFNYLVSNMPFCAIKDQLYQVPSATLIKFFLEKTSPKPIQSKYICGSVNDNTLRKLHEMHQHPMALYSAFVKSNLHDAEGYRCGPFVALLHDVGHCFWGSLLKPEDIDTLFNRLIPSLRLEKDVIKEIADFNLNAAKIFYKLVTPIQKTNLQFFAPYTQLPNLDEEVQSGKLNNLRV